MANAAFNKKECSFHQQNGIKLKEEASREYYIWGISLYGTETGTVRKVDQKYFEVLKCVAGEG
jgi:hypothetical protein